MVRVAPPPRCPSTIELPVMAITYAWPWPAVDRRAGMACYWKQCERGRGTPDPAERNVGGSFIHLTSGQGNALEAESPPVVSAGFALALFSSLKARPDTSRNDPIVRPRQTWELPRFGTFAFFPGTPPLSLRSAKPALKKIRRNGNRLPPNEFTPHRSAGAPPQSLNWHRS
jgi:hypothetical protein